MIFLDSSHSLKEKLFSYIFLISVCYPMTTMIFVDKWHHAKSKQNISFAGMNSDKI